MDHLVLFNIVSKFADLGENILRVEHRLYPDMFPDQKFLEIEKPKPIEKEALIIKIQNPFSSISDKFEEILQKATEIMKNEGIENEEIVKISMDLKLLRSEVFKTKRKIFTDLISLDFDPFANSILEKIKILEDSINVKVNEVISSESKKITDYYSISSKKLYGKNVFDQLHNLATVTNVDIPKVKSMFEHLFQKNSILVENFDLTELTILQYYQASRAFRRLTYLSDLIWEKLQVDRKKIEKSVIEKSSAIFYEAEMLERELKLCIKKYKLFKIPNQVKQLNSRFSEISLNLEKLAEEYPVLNNQLILLSMEPISIDIPFLFHQSKIFAQVSSLHVDTIACEEIYMDTKVQDVNTEEITRRLEDVQEKFEKTNSFLTSTSDGLAKETLDQLLPKIQQVVKTFSETLPMVKALRAEGMKERHWRDVFSETKITEKMRENLLVKDLISLDLTKKKEKCQEIVFFAGKELILESTLESMKNEWKKKFIKYRRVHGERKFYFSDEILLLLDDQIIKTQMTLSSPFAATLTEDLRNWLEILQSLQKIINLYQICESKVSHLEPLFTAEDIAYQMPEEWRMFQIAHEKWKALHIRLLSTKLYIELVSMDFQSEFDSVFSMFKRIQTGFDAYLQKRKLNSPRLHFLSNTELLELLSRARNPELVEPYLPKLFSSISKPEFNNRGEIVAVFSDDGERFEFRRPVNVNLAKRHVDKWILELEREMRNTLKFMIRNVLQKYGYRIMELDKMIQQGFIGQVILIHYRLAFTHNIESAILNGSLRTLNADLTTFSSKLKRFRSSNSRERLLLDNLLIELEDIQSTIDFLVNSEVHSIEHWAWTSQFRFYWSNENMFIRILNFSVLYGYEYLSVTKPFVKTPKIKELNVNLVVHQQNFFACLLQGPAATGKSETIKEISKILGKFCVPFNCSPQISIEKIENLISGALLSGTNLCLDEFNRLSSDVMASAINHLIAIYQSMESGRFRYKMNGLELIVNSMAAFYLSMNPGYVGRNPLPSNTTSVAKIIDVEGADLEAIAQEYFLLAKFKDSKKCASQLTTTFSQCSATVSPMRHYDFHLRTVLGTVKNAIWLRDSEKGFPEDVITIKAVQNLLSSMFTDIDSKIFSRILYFSKSKPMITDSETAYKTAIVQVCESMDLRPTLNFVNACYFLYLLSRHHPAMILVGKTLSGKSTTIKVVKEVLKQKDSIHFQLFSISPNLYDVDFLFGSMDFKKLEWTRGILTQKLVEEIHGGEERWIHIDGVIDSLWVESLNSLLDDNRKLNLGNGETIILNPQIRILFETDDLSKIALSTVSRCRVIYFDDNLIDPSVIGSSIDEGILEESIERCRILKLSSEETKPVFFRMSELYKIHDAFPKNDPQLGKLLFEISKMSVLDEEEFDENSSDEQNPENENRKFFSTFPQAFGQWMDLSTEKQPGVRFWRMFLKRILRSSLMLVVYGESGTGKTKFITDLVSTLNHEHWEIHVLSLSEETTSTSLLQSILDCNLVRIHSNHFTGPNAKNVLIILDGLSRLSMGKSFDCGIISNLDKWTNSEFVSFTILELKKSNFFTKAQIQEFSSNLIEIFEYIQKKFPGISSLKYLSFVKQFIHIVKEKKTSLDLLEKRYKTGISKLLKANEQMNFLQQELLRLQPELVRTSLETTVLMSQIERETIEIENAREVVAANEFKANEAATKAQSLKADCEQQVAEAIPALETAIDALQILNQSDISTLKTMRFPPQGVRMCMEAVCILLNEKPIKTADPLGNVTVDYWTPSQKILSDIHFLGRIRNFPRDKVSEKTMRLIRNKYLSKPEFDPESMKQVSLAAEGLCLWIKALDIYNKIAKVVEPKKEKLKKAELMVKQHMKQLEQRRKALQEVTERLQKLSDQFSHMGQRKQDLQNQIQGCELKIRRAEKLLEALGTEKERWNSNLNELKKENTVFKRNCLVGAHNSILISEKNEREKEPYGILELTNKVPLIIDPQGESGKFLESFSTKTLVTVDVNSSTLPQVVVSAIANGQILLVDNISKKIPLIVWQLLSPKIVTEQKEVFLQLDNKHFHFDPNFELILRTEHDFDQLPSKLLEKVCIINVAVGENIIRDQLMEIFLQVNALSLTEKRDQLASEKNNLIKKTDFLEETILDALAKSKDLDDDKTIDMLEEVRNSTKLLQEKMMELDEIEEQLRFLKNKFIKIGNYGTRLVNASLTISKFSSFYSRTLRFFLQVFRKAVAVENDQFNVENIEFINMKVSSAFRHKFARSLFARDRKLFDLFCLEQISLKNISQLTEKNFIRLFSTIPLEKLSNLRDQILHADPGLPIVLLLSSESNYVIRMLFSLADHFLPEKEGSGSDQNPKKNVQLFSAADLPESDWKTFLQQDQWLIVQNCENLKTDQMERLRETCKSIFKDESRKANFRLFLILYPDGELLIAKWIFLGINKHDDRILDEIKSMSFEDPGNISIKNSINRMRFLIDGMRPIKEGLLSGLSSSVVENYKNIELLKIYKNLKKMENKKEGGKFIFEMTISKSPEEAEGASALEKCVLNEIQFLKENDILPERQSILKSLLISKPLRKFCLYHFERPESLIETLKFIYARKYKILLEEIQIVGSLNFSESFVDESGFIDGFELLDCFLLGAGIDEKSKKVIESSRPLVKIKSLYLLARRKSTKSRTGFCLPFFYKSTLNSSKWREIAEIEVESSLPENHWLLRGVKFVTFENNEEFSSF